MNCHILKCLIYSVLEGGQKYTQIGLAMGVTIRGDDAKSGKNTNLLVIMRVIRGYSQPVNTIS